MDFPTISVLKFVRGVAWKKSIPFGLVILMVLSAGYGIVTHGTASPNGQTPAAQEMLSELWTTYKKTHLDQTNGRTMDSQRNNITTSEGESYTMLRAVWENDQATFNQSWNWTKDNLKRTDSLPAWYWGQRSDTSYGILTDQGGANTASDADTDMALSLIFASNRWPSNPAYRSAATQMMNDIWEQDVVIIGGKPVLAADNQERTNPTTILVNPSYFAPYAYTSFSKLDPSHDWVGLRENMYTLVDLACQAQLNVPRSANIPPDWITVDRTNGSIGTALTGSQTTNYSYDAMRLPFRLALDYQWNNSQEAKMLLSHFGFLDGQWKTYGKLFTAYNHEGEGLNQQEAPSIYGGSLGYFLVINPSVATSIYEKKLLPLYDQNARTWSKPISYYDDNWVWFGMALYEGLLPNLAN